MKLLKFTEVNGVSVLVRPETGFNIEMSLHIENNGEYLEISVPSREYENEFGEFMLKSAVEDRHLQAFSKVKEELMESESKQGLFDNIKLKKEYKELILETILRDLASQNPIHMEADKNYYNYLLSQVRNS